MTAGSGPPRRDAPTGAPGTTTSGTDDCHRDAPTRSDGDGSDAGSCGERPDPPEGDRRAVDRGRDVRREVLVATLQAETELLAAECDDLEAVGGRPATGDARAVGALASELDGKRRELRKALARYERALAGRRGP